MLILGFVPPGLALSNPFSLSPLLFSLSRELHDSLGSVGFFLEYCKVPAMREIKQTQERENTERQTKEERETKKRSTAPWGCTGLENERQGHVYRESLPIIHTANQSPPPLPLLQLFLLLFFSFFIFYFYLFLIYNNII